VSAAIYSDANQIIELAKLGRGTHDPARALDLEYLQRLLQAANNKDISLYTSSISIAECVAAGNDIGKEVQEFFIGVLTSGRMFKLVQDSIFVAEQARDLRWDHGINLKGADAIHVASAVEAQCTEFLTWDTDITKPKVQLLSKLGIAVITPSQTKLLPPIYATGPAPQFPW
jgi:predicted nucleic acid-binding protein